MVNSGSRMIWMGAMIPPMMNSSTLLRPRKIITSRANAAAQPRTRMIAIDGSVTMMLLSVLRPRLPVVQAWT